VRYRHGKARTRPTCLLRASTVIQGGPLGSGLVLLYGKLVRACPLVRLHAGHLPADPLAGTPSAATDIIEALL
jgi:hypothetical protein